MDPNDFSLEFIDGGSDGGSDGGGSDGGVAPPPRSKDKIVGGLIPERISECAIWVHGAAANPATPCMRESTLKEIAAKLGADAEKNVLSAVMARTGCATERCVAERAAATIPAAKEDLRDRYKVRGSTGNALLSNTQIDAVMRQFGKKFPDFFPYNFNMRDYASNSFRDGTVHNTPDSLATVRWTDLYTGALFGRKFTRCGCVINSDVYEGPGKHWMALYADAGTNTVEFFNSSGNAPAPEWINWLVKTRMQMEELSGKKATIVRVTAIRHQRSKSECGVYSLFYIWARLNGVPAEYFTSRPVPDQFMFEFRQHIFNDPDSGNTSGSKFSWSEFAGRVKIKWEK